jgi:tetratricopeptide (TPR) repeat protein
MSKLFDTLEQIRSNESRSLHSVPETAQTRQLKVRKKILAVVLVLCGIATGLFYFGDISIINQSGLFSKPEPAEKKSALNSSLPTISQQPPIADDSKNSNIPLSSDYTKAGKINSRSLQAWKKALQKHSLSKSDRAKTLNNIGSYYIFNNQHWKGLAYLDKALAIEPDNPIFLINFGIALAELGMIDLSIQYFQHARQIAPDNPALIKNLNLLKETDLMPAKFEKLLISRFPKNAAQ